MSSISVVIPSFNRLKTLQKTLNCLEMGSVLPEEVMIIDDGSKTSIRSEIDIKDYNINIKVIRNNKNRGASCSCNVGIREASSKTV